MQLLIHITNHESTVNPILSKMMDEGIKGASVVDVDGMLQSLNEDSVDAPKMFGGLRQFVNPERQKNKMIMAALKDEDVNKVIDIIHGVSGDLKLPNTGIFFTVPITRWEGISKE